MSARFCAVLTLLVAVALNACHNDTSPATRYGALNLNPSVKDFVLLAQNSVTIHEGSSVNGGDVGTTGAAPTAGNNVTFSAQAQLTTTNNILAQSVLLAAGAVVGDVQTSHLTDLGSTHGTVAGYTPPPSLPTSPSAAPGSADLTTPPSQFTQITICPTDYKTVTVSTGTVLLLQAGVYNFQDLIVEANASIIALGPVEIRIAGRFIAMPATIIGTYPSQPNAPSAGAIRIAVLGTDAPLPVSAGTPPYAMTIGAQSSLTGTFLVPNGTADIGATSTVTGAIGALAIQVEASASAAGSTIITFQDGFSPSYSSPTVCTDGNPCTTDSCSGGVCTNTPLAVDTTCSNGTACGGSHVCDANARCVCTPPDPATVAPANNTSVATTFSDSNSFLYSGSNPIQTGVAAGTIDRKRSTVIRGRVLDTTGQTLPGVTVSVLGHPEFGSTSTRPDGTYDFVVNGGDMLTVAYSESGFIPLQRRADPEWNSFTVMPDVRLTRYDSQNTQITLGAAVYQVARASTVTDGDGTRQETLIFPPNITATMQLPNGSSQSLGTIHVRATEVTVGANGPSAMTGDLPPTSGYTHATEFSVDEAVNAGATTVTFSQAIPEYLENFLNMPVGERIPLGYYDARSGQWVADNSGYVVKILSITNGTANLDIDGSGTAASDSMLSSIGITVGERQQLATLYSVGQTLWRIALAHFSGWDSNWGIFPPAGAGPPNVGAPSPPDDPAGGGIAGGAGGGAGGDGVDDTCGSIIGLQNQTLGEEVRVVGTPFFLHYASNRVPGRVYERTITIPLTGATLPGNPDQVNLDVFVAGRKFSSTYAPTTNLSTTFTWDGKDAYGRFVQGAVPVRVTVGYQYHATYERTTRFGNNGNGVQISSGTSRQDLVLSTTSKTYLTSFDSRGIGLGGWTINVHHVYNPSSQVLYFGDGRKKNAQLLGRMISTIAGNPSGSVAPDGSAATSTYLGQNAGLATGPDGSFYYNEGTRIRRVDPQGILHTVAGMPGSGFGGDGGPATSALLSGVWGIAIASDSTLYIADPWQLPHSQGRHAGNNPHHCGHRRLLCDNRRWRSSDVCNFPRLQRDRCRAGR